MHNVFFYDNFDITAIILLFTIILLLLSQRQIKNPTQRPFLWYLGLSILTTALNIISIRTLNNPKYSMDISYLFCNLFYISLEFEIVSVYLYFNRRFDMKRNLRVLYLFIPSVTVFLLLLNNRDTALLFSIAGDKSFTYGPLYPVIWVSGLLFFIDALIFLLSQKNVLQIRKVHLLTFCGFFLVGTTVAHYLVPTIQLLQFTNALLALIMFVEKQSPLLLEDLTTGALNNETFDDFVLNLIDPKDNLLFLYIKNTNISSELSSFSFIPKAYFDIVNKLKKSLKKSLIFRIDINTFAITYRSDTQRILAANICIDEFIRIKESTPAALPLRQIFAHTAPLSEFSDKTSLKNAIQWGLKKMRDSNTKLDVYITPEDSIKFARNRIIDTEIHKVANNKPMDFDLQPIFNIKTNKFDTAEALARIRVPSIGYVPCDEFITISENNGTIVAMGKSIMNEICHVINTIRMPFKNISINVSMIHFMEPRIVEDFLDILEKNDVSPSKIILEITESIKAVNWDLLKSNMFKLKEAGFTLSLDDFGTGYSSFESFLTLPFDIIKLDRNLLLACENEEPKKEILKKVVNMIKDLDFEIVLEGVETKEQDLIARELGVDKIQGFYYSKPLDTAGILLFVKTLQQENKTNFSS